MDQSDSEVALMSELLCVGDNSHFSKKNKSKLERTIVLAISSEC